MRALESKTKSTTNIWLNASSWIINHLAINPVKGGKPPKDKRDINVKTFVVCDCDEWFIIWEIWKDWCLKNEKASELETRE